MNVLIIIIVVMMSLVLALIPTDSEVDKLMKYIINRLKEASTWRGFVMLLTGLGISISPEHIAIIVSLGTGLAGALGIFTKDK